jgi:GMP synthase (glutamine-hydrolysing) A subunit
MWLKKLNRDMNDEWIATQQAFNQGAEGGIIIITLNRNLNLNLFHIFAAMTEKILILDFGSQYTQLIARAVREANVYCEIIPYHTTFEFDRGLKGIILSGSPFSVNDEKAPDVNVQAFIKKVPVLGVCYGAQLTAKRFGGRVEKSNKREYGRALLQKQKNDVLLRDVMEKSQVWMSHADTILELPKGFELLATTDSIPIAAFRKSAVGAQQSAVGSRQSAVGSRQSAVGSRQVNGKQTHDSRLTTFPCTVCNFIPKFIIPSKAKKSSIIS